MTIFSAEQLSKVRSNSMCNKKYESPKMTVTELSNQSIITVSGLVFGGESGKADKESFNSLFGK